MGRRFVKLGIVLASIAFSVALVTGCKKAEPQQAGAGGAPPAFVSVAPSETRDVPVYLEEIGKTTASEVVAIQPQVSGVVKEIHFVDGAEVKKGQMLFTIDPRPYEAALAQSKAMLSMNSASLTLARQEWDRVQGMQTTNAISKEEFEQRQSNVAVAEAQVEAANANIATSKVNLDYCFIKSPIDGRAGQRLIDVGNVVSPSSNQPMLTIQKLDPIYADFSITENHLEEVRKHMADHTLRTEVWTPEDAGKGLPPHEGDLTFLNNAVEDNSGTIKLRATLVNADRHFWPGAFVNVRLVLQVVKNAVLVPSRATQIAQAGPFVYVVNDKNIAELRNVKLGQAQPGEMVVVESGVAPGEKVVVSGHMMVRPNGPVMVMPSGPPQGAPSSGPSTAPSDHH